MLFFGSMGGSADGTGGGSGTGWYSRCGAGAADTGGAAGISV